MAIISYTVQFGSTFTPSNTLNDVQSVSTNHGRLWQTDPYTPASAIVQSRNIAAWTTAPKIGDYITIQQTGYVYSGFIKDVAINYGIVASMDTATITCEGPLSRWGRRQFTSRALAQAGTISQIMTTATAIGLDTFTYAYGKTGLSTAAAQTYVGNGLDLVNTLMTTEIGRVAEVTTTNAVGYYPTSWLRPRNDSSVQAYSFTDSNPTGAYQMYFDDISFASAAQNYYTEATINPLALASQTSGSGYYNITQDSFDYNTSQALSHAQYLVAQYNTTQSGPLILTASYSNQQTSNARTAFRNFITDFSSAAGERVNVTFRGTTYPLVIEGHDLGADLNDTILTISFSDFDNNNYLILNDSTFGTLGTSSTYPGNKLGF